MDSSSLEATQSAHLQTSSSTRHPTRPRLAFLLAASHSGSTLLAMLLGAQAGACSVGELKATSLLDGRNYRCSCKALICECPFWAQITQQMHKRGIPEFDITRAGTSIHEVNSKYARRLLAPLHRGPVLEAARDLALSFSSVWRNHRLEAGKRNVALMQSVLDVTGAEVIVDSSKVPLRLKYLLLLPELDVKVIRVIRDGRSVALTYMDDWNFADSADPALRGGGNGKMPDRPKRPMPKAAREWRRSNEAADCLLAGLPKEQWTEVRYEELCKDPEATLRRLNAFLGISPEVNLNFRAREHHVIGNGMRLDNSTEIRLDERWRTTLTEPDLAVFDEIAGPLNRKYGYT